ncbi:MAG TPA: orotidine-5'-phosphate decarboxylase [Alphaproteobacteria bacterium]|nr:orotidine-5'-phosphate decarboxylase [Alphaproteobacteria bacterium]
MNNAASRIVVAIDRMRLEDAHGDVAKLKARAGVIKLGLEFFVANGPQGVRAVAGPTPLFLDLKLHDIPNTVSGGVRSACQVSPKFITIHAAGGESMMRAAADAAKAAGSSRPLLLAITVLTSLDDGDLDAVGQHGPVGEQAKRLAVLAKKSGLDGVVCSAHETAALRAECGKDFLLVVPGIRPSWATSNDQKRVVTPVEAVRRGADYLVIGRPITQADDPASALERIAAEIGAA